MFFCSYTASVCSVCSNKSAQREWTKKKKLFLTFLVAGKSKAQVQEEMMSAVTASLLKDNCHIALSHIGSQVPFGNRATFTAELPATVTFPNNITLEVRIPANELGARETQTLLILCIVPALFSFPAAGCYPWCLARVHDWRVVSVVLCKLSVSVEAPHLCRKVSSCVGTPAVDFFNVLLCTD